MAQRRHHYENAFEGYLRSRRMPYVSVDEARRALLPEGAELRLIDDSGADLGGNLKSFDFVVYGPGRNLLIDVKGRKIPQRGRSELSAGRLESWVTEEDVTALGVWRTLFGYGFEAVFVFMYWCEAQPPDGLFQEIFEHHGRWYALRAVRLDAYAAHMKSRSRRWATVCLPQAAFDRISEPFSETWRGGAAGPGPGSST